MVFDEWEVFWEKVHIELEAVQFREEAHYEQDDLVWIVDLHKHWFKLAFTLVAVDAYQVVRVHLEPMAYKVYNEECSKEKCMQHPLLFIVNVV